ncbi:unnamed protein product [Sphagnum troendelagicum]|uniref:Methyltransferase type 11 domain-containing protein n=1 Tax=Sphagnum troendelagicum TaxID=128251 RepID=A0ABP0U488_9BRYO
MGVDAAVPLPKSLKEFGDEKYWDDFFRASKGQAFEWYGSWADLPQLLQLHCGLRPDQQPPLQILVVGCGNSALSAHMYDAGFTSIVNVDFNRRVITEMLRLHVRARPLMRWLVMDITALQFAESSFDVVVDKGSLDALTGEPEEPLTAAISLLSEVKRVLRPGGQYVCVTLAQKHVIGVLLETLRQGWEICLHQVSEASRDPSSPLQPFLVVATKTNSADIPLVTLLTGDVPHANSLVDVVNEENKLRSEARNAGYKTSLKPDEKEVESKLQDIYEQLHPGRRNTVVLGGHYPAVVMDAKPHSASPTYRSAVFLVPKGRAHEWLFSSEEGQWQVLESAQAGRLILVMLDTHQYPGSLSAVQDELSPLVKQLLPLDCRDAPNVPYMTTNDGLYRRTVVEEIESPMTGTIQVEDVVLDADKSSGNKVGNQNCFRRLVFRRNPNLIQSDASLVLVKGPSKDKDRPSTVREAGRRHGSGKKKGKAKDSSNSIKQDSAEEFKVDHSHLVSKYHEAMIVGLSLIAENLEQAVTKVQIRALVVGLGAGLLPMFLHNHLPIDHIQVVELDGVIGDVAKRQFGFVENDRMQLHVGDGIEAVYSIARLSTHISKNTVGTLKLANDLSGVHCNERTIKTEGKLHILFIDADSQDPSNGLSCPPAEFLEEPFLHAASDALVEGGILAINVVSRAAAPHVTSVEMLRKVFEEVYDLEIDEDVNRVLLALPQKSPAEHSPGGLQAAASTLGKLAARFNSWGNGPSLKDAIRTLKRLK